MTVIEVLGAEASVTDLIHRVLAGGYTNVLVVQLANKNKDEVIILERPTEDTLRDVCKRFEGYESFEIRSDKVIIGGAETLALHIIAS